MSLPAVRTTLLASDAPVNPQDLSSLAHVVGPCSAGPIGVPTLLAKPADLAQFGWGPGIEMAGEIGATAGWPLLFTRSTTTTVSVLGTITKTDPAGAVGTPFTLYGGVIIPGADKDGRVFIRAKDDGVTITVVQGADGDTLLMTAVGKAITIRTAAAAGAITTTGTLLQAYVLPVDVALLIEQPVKYGTGASLITAMASTALAGKIVVTPKVQGVKLKFSTYGGNDTALSAAVANTTEITVTPGTNTDSQPTLSKDSATQLKAAIDAVASALVTVTVGTGALMSGIGAAENAAAFHNLVFGSTAALSISGTPNDGYPLQLKAVRAAAVAASPAPTIRWSADGGVSWSSETVIPASGSVALKDSLLDTGLTATFTGTLAADDLWTATSTVPASSGSDLLTAYDAALATGYRFGFITGPDSVTRAQAALIDAKIQAKLQVRFVKALLSARDIAEGVPGETEAQWISALISDYQGFVSARGLCQVVALPVQHLSPYTGRSYRRPGVFCAAARRASNPMHANIGKVRAGVLANVTAIYHDEALSPGLHDQRFITGITYPQKPGFLYLAGGPTMADPSDVAWTLEEWVTVALSGARAAAEAAVDEVNDSLPGIAAAEKDTGAPKGALTLAAANDLQVRINQPVETLITKTKTDGKSSASPQPEGVPFVQVLRNNNYISERQVNLLFQFVPLGLNQVMSLGVSVKVP